MTSVEKGFIVLEAFAQERGELTLTDLVKLTGYSMATIQRITKSLQVEGYIERPENRKTYRLTHRCIDLLNGFLMLDPLVKKTWPRLLRLSEITGLRASLTVLEEERITHILRVQGPHSEFGAALIGRRLPAYCTSSGRAVLSQWSEDEIDRLLANSDLKPITHKTLTDPSKIKEQIAQAKREGFCITDEEFLLGDLNIAAPIVDRQSQCTTAIVLSGQKSEWDIPKMKSTVAPLLLEAIRTIE